MAKTKTKKRHKNKVKAKKNLCEHESVVNVSSDQMGTSVQIKQVCQTCNAFRYMSRGTYLAQGPWSNPNEGIRHINSQKR